MASVARTPGAYARGHNNSAFGVVDAQAIQSADHDCAALHVQLGVQMHRVLVARVGIDATLTAFDKHRKLLASPQSQRYLQQMVLAQFVQLGPVFRELVLIDDKVRGLPISLLLAPDGIADRAQSRIDGWRLVDCLSAFEGSEMVAHWRGTASALASVLTGSLS